MDFSGVNLDEVTVQDCIDLYEKKQVITICEDGQVKEFKFEK